ncbi:MAG: response regulator [Desulfobacterales bacterium]|nr:response regulator [Desulfobacterales bacterium]
MNDRIGTILFVDDEESILEIVEEYFQHKGYKVITANNGIEATEILKHEPIDCCFTDINMPEMDGLELAEYIWNSDKTVPVIVMTGYPSMETTIKTMKSGVVDFLIKPVSLNQMELCLQRVLRERKLFVENILLKKELAEKQKLEKLNKELLYKVEELHTLNKIMSSFTLVGTTADVYKQLTDLCIEISKASESKFYIINETLEKSFEVASSIYQEKLIAPINNLEIPEHLIMEIAKEDLPLLISENKGQTDFPNQIKSFMGVPLKIREKVFGVLVSLICNSDKRFNERDLYYISFMAQNASYTIENLIQYEIIFENLSAAHKSLINANEARDPYTKQHSHRVTTIAVRIAKQIGCNEEELDILRIAGPLHDIGKIGIRDDILLKPGRLTDDEFKKIKEHPDIGAKIIGEIGMWEHHQLMVRHHHERYDGKGYPDGLKGEEIPFLARILSVADSYDAMASDRAYRRKMEDSKILKILEGEIGKQFDPQIIEVFLKMYKDNDIVW